jgi:hypothetical protein
VEYGPIDTLILDSHPLELWDNTVLLSYSVCEDLLKQPDESNTHSEDLP